MSKKKSECGFYIPVNKESFADLRKFKKFKWRELAKVTGWTDRAIRRAVYRGSMPLTLYVQIMDYLGVEYVIEFKEFVFGTKNDKDKTPFIISDEWQSDELKR